MFTHKCLAERVTAAEGVKKIYTLAVTNLCIWLYHIAYKVLNIATILPWKKTC